jgi:Uncharacterized protein conserved in bacteria
MSWTNERIELLQKLWLEGWSASRIARELACGITRNAVIGKVYRLALSGPGQKRVRGNGPGFAAAPKGAAAPGPPACRQSANSQSANRRQYRPRFSPIRE